MSISVGVDIGGSHVTAIAVNLENKTVHQSSSTRKAVDCNGSADEILSIWAESIGDTLKKTDNEKLIGIGFAMPGPFDYQTGIARFKGVKKFENLYGVNVKEEIRKRLGLKDNLQIRFVNDATCFAIGETWIGKASEYKRVVAITLGTGFGSAFLDNGVPVETGTEVAPQGCLYHISFQQGIADEYFSTRWFVDSYFKSTGKSVSGVYELSRLAGKDSTVDFLFRSFGDNLAKFLTPWLKLFKTECLVMGGNISLSLPYFENSFFGRLASEGLANLNVVLSSLGEEAAIIGSARLSDASFYSRLDLSANK
jgi:glucokinase